MTQSCENHKASTTYNRDINHGKDLHAFYTFFFVNHEHWVLYIDREYENHVMEYPGWQWLTRIIKDQLVKSVFIIYIELCRSIFLWLDFCSECTFTLDQNYNFITGRSSFFWHLCWEKKLQTSKRGYLSHLHA